MNSGAIGGCQELSIGGEDQLLPRSGRLAGITAAAQKLAGPGFQCMEVVMSHKVDSLILTFFPIRQSAITGVAGNFRAFVWIEAPASFPVAASRAMTRSLGVVAKRIAWTIIGLHSISESGKASPVS